MSASVISSDQDGCIIQLSFKYSKSMFEGEKEILKVINDGGCLATGKLLEQFDTDGAPIIVGDQTFTSKGKHEKNYQTPFGTSRVDRHVYQSHSGGKTYCPLENDARIIITSTPKFAQIISSKYSQMSVRSVEGDLENNHDRKTQKKTIQEISEAVGSMIIAKEDTWEYEVPEFEEAVKGISIGLDGTCMLMKKDGWREAMTGTISLYDKHGERMHTRYIAAPPEYGKQTFLARLENDIESVKKQFPNVVSIGLADGAHDNWSFLNKHTDCQLLDFYHATEYLGSVGKVLFPNKKQAQEKGAWIEDQCHKLKHNTGGATRFLNLMKEIKLTLKKKADKETLAKSITYFKNNIKEKRMEYYKYVDSIVPLGSGATEAACKVIVKQRMCKSGMRWQNNGAQIVLATRSLHETTGNWDQFWGKVDRFGFNMAA